VIAILGHNGSARPHSETGIGTAQTTSGHVLLEGVETRKLPSQTMPGRLVRFQSPSQMLFPRQYAMKRTAFGPENLGHEQEKVTGDVEWGIETVILRRTAHTPLALSFGQQKRSQCFVLSMRSVF
jgi:energy-coupling factor transport system ATP-binding protein